MRHCKMYPINATAAWLVIGTCLIGAGRADAQYIKRWCNSPYCAMCNAIDRANAQIALGVNQQIAAAQVAAARRSAETAGTPHEVIPQLVALLQLDSDSELVDLGCGDGRVVFAAAERTGCRATGIEIDRQLAQQAFSKARAGVSIMHGDVLQLPPDYLSGKCVYVYLFPQVLEKLRPQLEHAERVVSLMHDPGLGGSDRVTLTVGVQSYTVFVWRQPKVQLPLTLPPMKS